ncbi:hypothetical protein [Flavobacterium crassostreae]|nr:hypothetical protein [Flavobacterium crassostreae]
MTKNTTRMGGDFLANPQGLTLLLRKEHGNTFALEMGQNSILALG